MSTFVTGKDLENEVYNIIWEAKERLLLLSPYIKLNDYFQELFEKHKKNPELQITIAFGKNENDLTKSLNNKDFAYFKEFPNISIVYIPKLHAKYYGNEKKGIITSLNLHNYSIENNIEFGVFTEHNLLSKFMSNADNEAFSYSMNLALSNMAVFINRPVYEKKLLSNKYVRYETLLDSIDEIIKDKKVFDKIGRGEFKKISDFKDFLSLSKESSTERPSKNEVIQKVQSIGYCIRTGIEIPFNPQQPFSLEAYKSWSIYKNQDFKEKYCHKTGKFSNGKTSMRHPILED